MSVCPAVKRLSHGRHQGLHSWEAVTRAVVGQQTSDEGWAKCLWSRTLDSDHPPPVWPELSPLLCIWAGARPGFTWGSSADLEGTPPGKEIECLECDTVTLLVRVKNRVCMCMFIHSVMSDPLRPHGL